MSSGEIPHAPDSSSSPQEHWSLPGQTERSSDRSEECVASHDLPSPPESVSSESSTRSHGVSVPEEHSDHSALPDSTSLEFIRVASECLHAQDYATMVQTLAHIERRPSPSTAAAYEFGTGLGLIKMKKYSAAIGHFARLEQMPTGDAGHRCLAHCYLGEIELACGNFQEAASHYDTAIASYVRRASVAEMFRTVTPSLSGLYCKLAASLRNASEVMSAVQAYKSAIATAETKKDKLSAHTSLGNLYQSVGENASALKEYEQSIVLSEELKDHVALGWAHGNVGNAYLSLYQRDKALLHLEQSLELAVLHEPTPQTIGRAYNNLGTAHQALNELDKAWSYYDLALSQAVYGNNTPGQARVYGNIGNLLMVQKKYDSVIAHYTDALSISSDRSTCSTVYLSRGCARYQKAESDGARLGYRYELTCFRGPQVASIEAECPVILPESILKQYCHTSQDLVKVVQYHEETFQTIKGSSKGLTLSVPLFESNSRTFHRLQDSLCCLEKWQEALVYAEQSRSRTLGELLLQRRSLQLPMPITDPLTLEQITEIVKAQDCDVVYLSYTGTRLLVWVLTPEGDSVSINMFQVCLKDDQFEGKSLDRYLKYSLTELLTKKVELFAPCDFEDVSAVAELHKLLAQPLLKVFDALRGPEGSRKVRDIVVIPDACTNCVPLVALFDADTQQFLGDGFSFRIMPSLLTMGVMNQLPPVTVDIPEDSNEFFVAGSLTGAFSPPEAEWVSHILKCSPALLHETAIAPVLGKLAKAKVIHVATRDSAAASFPAFARLGSSQDAGLGSSQDAGLGSSQDAGLGSSQDAGLGSSQDGGHSKNLVRPEDIEHMSISPALVVLSSCDSGGMAQAFILAGAQAVLTTLWRVPDESACVFMQFLYQYLVDGLRGTEALQKAVVSLRCFSKYSAFIHWSGYQLTGRDIRLLVATSPEDGIVGDRIGQSAVFPHLALVKKLEEAFLEAPNRPTDVQVFQGPQCLRPSEPVIDFISKNHTHFPGGVFWLNCSYPELITAAAHCIRKVLDSDSTPRPTLVILENAKALPNSEALLPLLQDHDAHIVVTTSLAMPADGLRQEAACLLQRGCAITQVNPLSVLHATQRIVHSILKTGHLSPSDSDRKILCQIAEKTCGSPDVVDIASALLQKCSRECDGGDLLEEFTARTKNLSSEREPTPPSSDPTGNVTHTGSITDFVSSLIDGSQLPSCSYFLLCIFSCFGCAPLPRAVVEIARHLVVGADDKCNNQGMDPLTYLTSAGLLRVHPAAVVIPPGGSKCTGVGGLEPSFYYVPPLVCDALRSRMEEHDKAFCVSSAYKALEQFSKEPTTDIITAFVLGLSSILMDGPWKHAMDDPCYKKIYQLYRTYQTIA